MTGITPSILWDMASIRICWPQGWVTCMRASSRELTTRFVPLDWQPETLQLLDEHHLVAWSHASRTRTAFAAGLSQFLASQRDLSVCVLHGRSITNLDGLCQQLERQIPGPPLDRRIGGSSGVIELLRSREHRPGRPSPRQRIILWSDADVLLRADHELFGRVVDALTGVAAELEYASDDQLLIQRTVFVGAPALDLYAEDPSGQFRGWRSLGDDEAFWTVVSGLDCPPMMRVHIDSIMAPPARRA